jgi:CheY-like chemotaxis protein
MLSTKELLAPRASNFLHDEEAREVRQDPRPLANGLISAMPDLDSCLAGLLQSVAAVNTTSTNSFLEGVRVLIVPGSNPAELRDTVEECGGSVTVASSAQDATQLLSRVRPDVLISDLTVPGNGLWLIEEAERIALEEGLSFSAIAVTARKSEYQRQRLLRAGYRAYLGKPLDREAFCDVVAGLVGRKLPEDLPRSA